MRSLRNQSIFDEPDNGSVMNFGGKIGEKMSKKLNVKDPVQCIHDKSAEIKLPGSEHRLGWCRECGCLWLPTFEEFTIAFEEQPKRPTGSTVGVRYTDQPGMWLYPGYVIKVEDV